MNGLIQLLFVFFIMLPFSIYFFAAMVGMRAANNEKPRPLLDKAVAIFIALANLAVAIDGFLKM